MLIALIDDGIETSLYPNIRVKYDLSVGEDCIVRNRDAEERIITDHGTTCARTIAKYAPHAEFCSLRIFHKQELRASCAQLVAAMEWCLVARIPIVHMSLGSSQPSDYKKIRSIVARMIQQRQIIVAACSNSEVYSVPARIYGVLGVVADKGLDDDEYTIESDIPPGYNLVRASSRHRLVVPSGHKHTTQITNSYAAPTVTAAVHNVLEQSGALSLSALQVYAQLAKGLRVMPFSKPDHIENAIIYNPGGFPILKEHLFFNCLAGHSRLEQISNGYSSVVYMASPDADVAQFDIFMQEQTTTIKSLLYGGIMPQRDKLLLSEGMVWSEDCCNYPEQMPVQQKRDLPAVINLYGQGLKAIDVMCQLRDLFVADGYHCRGLSDYPYAYLYDLEFVPKGASAEAAVAYISQLYQPEVVINNFQVPGHEVVAEHDDYAIFMEDKGSYISGFLSEKQSYIKSGDDKTGILLLYNKILSHFL